jgi:hypothetical protein
LYTERNSDFAVELPFASQNVWAIYENKPSVTGGEAQAARASATKISFPVIFRAQDNKSF